MSTAFASSRRDSRAPGSQRALAAEQRLHDMSVQDATRLQALWQSAISAKGDFGSEFYARLFAANPKVADLFPGDMEAQRRRLVETLGDAFRLAEYPEHLVLLLRAAGVRHGHYGVKHGHFRQMETALIDTLGQRLGDNWSDADETLFRAWFRSASLVMRQAMAEALRG